jgi:FlaA1/EpsC-like NDP-sugar epimerase
MLKMQAKVFMLELWTQIPVRRILQVILDALLALCAIACAFAIRFDGAIGQTYLDQLVVLAPLFVCLHLAANWFFGVYRRLWRYTGLTEVTELGISVLTVTTIVLLARALGILKLEAHHLSYGIIFIESGLSFLLLVSPRVMRRLETEHRQRRHWRQPVRQRALVVGAGEAGQMVAREMSQRPDVGVDVIGLIDDDPHKIRTRIGHHTVYGTTDDLPALLENLFIDQVIIAIPSAPPQEVRRIVEICRNAEVQTRILPGLYELIDGRVSVNQLREVSLEDLLGREPVELNTKAIAGYIEGRRILITGAGGSIGSELCRQIIKFQPEELLLLGKGENSIFSIYHELKRLPEPVKLTSIIADVRDYQRMVNIFEKHRPQVVFHAAAHKHVPLMEENVPEAISNNISGTQNLAELANAYKVETFVLVSTDKAVNPTSVMGATKRVAELIVQDLSSRSQTKYAAVRFGNVLDSRGSVLPFWRSQIASGGPVTVTHPEVIRYFMLIPEAVQLVIQAGALGSSGEIFVLDMGEPVKMLDLANDLIKLSGLRPGEDIQIEIVGLRPGEKLFEELLTAEEGLSKTIYKKIFVGKPQPYDNKLLVRNLNVLFEAAKEDKEETVRSMLNEMIGGTLLVTDALQKSKPE